MGDLLQCLTDVESGARGHFLFSVIARRYIIFDEPDIAGAGSGRGDTSNHTDGVT